MVRRTNISLVSGCNATSTRKRKIFLSEDVMSTALIGWLLYSIDGAALAEGLSQASLLSMSAAFVVMLALSLVGVFTKVRWSPRWD